VTGVRAAGAASATEVGTWRQEDVLTLARAADDPEAEAILLPDTALRTAGYVPLLEKSLSKPVLTANQVTAWEALRLTDRRVNAPELGTLFTREPVVQV
jgi:maleate cis-trans isomerase